MKKTVLATDAITINYRALGEIIALLQAALDKHGESTMLHLYSEHDTCWAEIEYQREETDAEYERRVKLEDVRLAHRKQQYEALKKEFGE